MVGGRATAWLYGGIGQDLDGFGGVDAPALVAELDALTVPDVTVRVNSPGGRLDDSMTLHDAVRRLAGRSWVTARVDALCGSGATLVALAAHEIVTAPRSRWFIHEPVSDWAAMADDGVLPDPGELAELAELRDHDAQRCAAIYAERTGESPALWRERMNGTRGRWFTATEAVAVGLADRIG